MNDYERTQGVLLDADPTVDTTAQVDGTADADPEARVEQLTAEIDDTRKDLTQTIGEIGQRLDPSNIAHEATETVRQATLGKVEQMTYGAQETWRDVRTGNAGSIVDTLKSNPIPAGMAVLGIGMLFMKRGKQAQQGSGYPGNGSFDRSRASWEAQGWDRRQGGGYGQGGSPFDKVGSTLSDAGDKVGSTLSDAGDKVGEVKDQAGQKVSDALESVGEHAGQIPEQAGHYLEQGGNQVRRFIDENPLGAGVIAVAAGAAIGLLLPSTPIERTTIGPARDQLVEKVEGTVNEALDKVDAEAEKAQATPA